MLKKKLVSVEAGAIWDIVVDARPGSATFGNWAKIQLSEENGKQLFIPAGFLHGFLALSGSTKVCYKIAGKYSVEDAVTVDIFDPDLGIELNSQGYIQSEKDLCGVSWKELSSSL